MINLGSTFPNFEADTTVGKIKFHDWLGDSWGILFSHPSDFTPVCTTELSRVLQLIKEFEQRKTKVIALSCDSVESHLGWIKDIQSYSGGGDDSSFSYPIIADESRSLAVELGMLDPVEKDSKGMPLTCRAVFIVDPSKKLRLSFLYPATTGRNFDEILRVLDSLQLTDTKKVATPVDWKVGKQCMILPTVPDPEAKELFPQGFETVSVPSNKGYIRKVLP
ncbi:hypothetical protein WDU94_008511 [Cyamophila willieti]